MNQSSGDVTYVLVPGAWCGAWAWDDVIDRLEGRPFVALDLPSTGDDPDALGDLADDAAHVRTTIDAVDGPVVVCGHSYGGMVVNEVADHPSVVHSIYLAAFWPPRPEATMVSIIGELFGPGLPPWIIDRGDDSLQVSDDFATAREAFCLDVDEARSADIHSKLRLQSVASFVSPSSGKPHPHPTTYVVCDQDRAISPAAQETMSTAADAVVHLDAAHFPQVSKPDDVTAILVSAPTRASRPR